MSSTVDRGPALPHHAAMPTTLLLLLTLALQSGDETFPSHDPAADLIVPAGLEVSLAAESPLFFNPTAMDVDERGRLWVTEAVNYRKWDGRNPGREHSQGDRVMVLHDDDGDGVYDRSTVFAQEPRLVAPLGIAVFGNKVVVSCSPHLIVYTDDDGDDVADRSEVLLTGFGGHDHDHGLHSVVAGPDGRWWFAVGNAGPHLVTDRSGWTLRSGSLYTGGGPERADNKPGLVSDDGRVWVGGLILSVNPDGTDLAVHAHNFRNQYEVAIDSFGEMYTEDNDDDGNRGCRTLWVMEGSDNGYFSADGSRYWSADRRPGQDTQTAHWHQDDPGVSPAGTINGAGGPTGVAVYEGALMADWIDGAVLNADAGAGRVYAHRPRAQGAGIVLDPGVLISARDDEQGRGARWFRPSDVVVASDGSVLVADWYDPGVGGHQARDAQAYGRILRIAPVGHRVSVPSIDVSTPEGAVAALMSPAVNVRQLGRDLLLRETAERWGEAVQALLDGPDERAAATAVYLLQSRQREAFAGGLDPAILTDPGNNSPLSVMGRRVAGDDRDAVELVTARGLLGLIAGGLHPLPFSSHADGDPLVSGVDSFFGSERSLAIAREVALRSLPAPAVDGTSRREEMRALWMRNWLDLALSYPVGDRYALEAVGAMARGNEAACFDALLEHFGAPIPLVEMDGPPRVVELAWRLHPPAATPGLITRAQDTALPLPERRRMLDALGFCPEYAAAEAMLALALTGPDDTRELARFWVEHGAGALWSAHGLGVPALGGTLADTTLAWSNEGVARREVFEVEIDVSGARSLWIVTGDGDNGNACDWAAIVDPVAYTPSGPVSLAGLPTLASEIAWGRVGHDVDCEGGVLSVGGQAVTGIGTHAPSVLAWELPAGSTRFTARLAAEDTGLSQGDPPPTSITWELRLHTPPDYAALRALEEVLRDTRADPDDRDDAALALAEDADGGMVVVDLARQGVLDEELLASVGEVIFAHPDPAVRALAHGLFPRPGGLTPLPPLEELLSMAGDPSRGRALFLSQRTQCNSCHRMAGRGTDVGPDLTDVSAKLDGEALLDAILNPSAGIAHGYDGWLISTADGRRMTGFVLADGEQLLFKDSSGKRHVLSADEVVDRYPLSLSIMPEGVALGLEPQELADLMAFLREDRRAPGSPHAADRLGQPVVLFDGSSLDAWRAFLPGGEDPAETWSIVGDELICEGRPIGYLRTRAAWSDYVLELEWRFLPGRELGNSGVLLRLNGDDQVWPRSFEAQLQHRNAGDIWNIEAMGGLMDAARTSGRRTVKLLPSNERPHGEWNRYRITLHRDRLTLEVNGEVQNSASWCEELSGPLALQSEGAPIAFRNVVLTPIVRGLSPGAGAAAR
ncbi:MAG: hypothetical protein DRQ55_01805 [Planctomycetota bacterium]|nr:MAG: hypothetical protein DRQ55_01805 [Planctomycetota bacterium]